MIYFQIRCPEWDHYSHMFRFGAVKWILADNSISALFSQNPGTDVNWAKMLSSQNTPEKPFLIAVFTASCVLFLLFSYFLYQEYSYTRRSNESVIQSYEQLRATRAILIDLLNMETGVRGYLLTGQPQFLQPYNEAKIWLSNEVDGLRNLVKDKDSQTQAMTDKIFYEIKKYDSFLTDEMRLANHPSQFLVSRKTLKKQKESMDHLRQSLQAFIQFSQNNLDAHLDKLKQKHQKFTILLTAGTLGIIGTIFLAMMTILSLSNRNRESEEAARATEERFRIVMNGINDGLFDYNVAQELIYFSPAYKAMLGFEDNEFPNTIETFNSLLHPEDIENTWETFRRYQQHETSTYINYFRMRHNEGGWRWIMARGIGIWDKNDNMLRLIGTHADITEQKKREEELKELNTDLESFAYIASHDLRAPLVNLKGFAREMEHSMATIKPIWKQAKTSLPQQDTEAAEQIFEQDIPEALKFIQQSVDKMDLLTNAVLDLSRIGRRNFLTEPVDVHAIATRSLDNLAYELGRKEVAVHLGKLPIILSDPIALEQILSNLLDNAVKYLEPSRKGEIKISCDVLNDEIIFSIADNGRGINEQDHNKIFEIFRRARNVGDERGIGMGLAYVKTTLRKLGGSIWFESQLNQGTVFHVRLPLRPPAYREQQERAD